MKRLLLSLLAACVLVAGASAQTIDGTQYVDTESTGACNTGACAAFLLPSAPSLTVDVSGTFTGTLTFEATSDGYTWRTLSVLNTSTGGAATTATAAGLFAVNNIGYVQVRVRATAWSSGSARVSATRGWASARAVPGAGHLLFTPDNTYDIGASGATRPRDVRVARNIIGAGVIEAGAGSTIYFSGRSAIGSSSDGVIALYNNANTDFSRLQFGGTTSSFPALKRNAAQLDVKLADDSGHAQINAQVFQSASTTGGVILQAAAGAASNPGIANYIRLYIREDLDSSGAGGADCDLVARLNSGTEVLITRLVLNGACP
jgi:hypothetical protein